MLVESFAQPRTTAVRVALRRADGHAGSLGDLFERIAERILEQHDLGLRRRYIRERLAKLPPELRDAGRALRVVLRRGEHVVRQQLVLA